MLQKIAKVQCNYKLLFLLSKKLKVKKIARIAKDILGDPGADSGREGKSKRVEKHGMKKSKEWQEEPLGTMSDQTSSKRSPPFCLLIRQKNTKVFLHQSEVRMAPPLSAPGSSRMSKRQIQQNLDFKKG